MNGLLIFKYSNEEFCIEIKNLKGILKNKEVNFPIGSKKTEGEKIKFSSHDYSLVDMSRKLGFNSFKQQKENRLLFAEFYSQKFCFFVEEIPEIIMLDKIFIQHNIEFTDTPEKIRTKWKLKFEGRDLYFPDYESICKELGTKNEINVSRSDLLAY